MERAQRPAHQGLTEPVPRLLERVLRDLVRRQADRERAGDRSARVHVGIPGAAGVRTLDPAAGEFDAALRVDALEAMARADIEAGRVPLTWVGRRVDGADVDDLAWSAAAAAAGAELGVRLDLVVVTGRSWRDPRSGAERSWARPLRRRPPRAR